VSRFIVDASVAIKWFAEEELRLQALALRDQDHALLSVDYTLIEVASGLLRKARRNTYPFPSFQEDIEALRESMDFFLGTDLLDEAAAIANRHRSSIYDSLYVALAVRQDCPLVTADERLLELLRPAYRDFLLWLGDVIADPR
jgi:predicted nucleic acid-binding protein